MLLEHCTAIGLGIKVIPWTHLFLVTSAGKAQATTFDQLVLESLVDSLVRQGQGAASAPLGQLLQCVLCTVLWRYLDLTDQQRRLGSERTQVNAMRFLEVRPTGCSVLAYLCGFYKCLLWLLSHTCCVVNSALDLF